MNTAALAVLIFGMKPLFLKVLYMAKIKSPLHSVQAAGKADGLIYARNQYGAYTRDYVIPDQPDSAAQTIWQDAMSACNAAWNNIAFVTPLRLTWWQSFAKAYKTKNRFGQPCFLGPKEWFIKFNIWKAAKGISLISDPPKDPTTIWFPQINIFWDTGGIYATVYPYPTSTRFVQFRYSGPHNHTRTFPPNTLSFAGNFDASSADPLKLIDAAAIDTDPHNWFFRYRTIDEFGRASPPVYVTVFTYGSAPTAIVAMTTANRIDQNDHGATFLNPNLARCSGVSPFGWRTLFVLDLSALTYEFVEKSYLYYYPVSDSVGTFQLHDYIVLWDTASASWDNAETGVPWQTGGGELGTDLFLPYFFEQNLDNAADQWYRIDITDRINTFLSSGGGEFRFWLWPGTSLDNHAWNYSASSSAFIPYLLNVPLVTP